MKEMFPIWLVVQFNILLYFLGVSVSFLWTYKSPTDHAENLRYYVRKNLYHLKQERAKQLNLYRTLFIESATVYDSDSSHSSKPQDTDDEEEEESSSSSSGSIEEENNAAIIIIEPEEDEESEDDRPKSQEYKERESSLISAFNDVIDHLAVVKPSSPPQRKPNAVRHI